MAQASLLTELVDRINNMTVEQRAEHEATVMAATANMKFIPSPGPQTDAYHCKADILLYGGEGGGGKSALINGLALTAQKRSLIMRRQYTDLSSLTEEIIKFNGTRQGYNGSIPPTLRTSDDRFIEFGAAQREDDVQQWMGRPHDFIGIDEAWQFMRSQIRFLIGWLRSTDPDQRCRVVLATNPPLSAEGEWLVEMFRPWLDPGYHNPAKQGELRWYVTNEDGDDDEVMVTLDAAGRAIPKIWLTERKEYRDATEPEIEAKKQGIQNGVLFPMSRTFIRARVTDNPFLANTDYAAKLDSLDKNLRASMRDGNFMASRRDDDWQIISSESVRLAQERWTPRRPEEIPMTGMGVDVAGGGSDNNAISPRYDGWYAPLTIVPGKETPNGVGISGHVVRVRTDGCTVGIDMGGGFGSMPYNELINNDIEVMAYKGAEGSNARTKDGVYGFFNKRSEMHWRMREALDPDQPGGSIIQLPPDPILAADLCAARYTYVNHKGKLCVKVEEPEEIKARLGRSPDRGYAVMISNITGTHGRNYQDGNMGSSGGRSQMPKVNMGHSSQRRRH